MNSASGGRLGRDWVKVWGPAAVLVGLACGLGFAILAIMQSREQALLPYPSVGELRQVQQGVRGSTEGGQLSSGVYTMLARSLSAWELGAYRTQSVTLSVNGTAQVVGIAAVTPSLPVVLGAMPRAGRFFTEADAPAAGPDMLLADAPVAILSHELWMRRFGGDPRVVGSDILLDTRPFRVIGVAAAHAMYPAGTDVWVPMTFGGLAANDYGGYYLRAVARARQGTAAQADAEWDRLQPALAATSSMNRDIQILRPAFRDYVLGDAARALRLLGLLASAVVVLVGINIAGLMLGWETLREREHAVLFALGATMGELRRRVGAMLLPVWGAAALIAAGVAWATGWAARGYVLKHGIADDVPLLGLGVLIPVVAVPGIVLAVASIPTLVRLSHRKFGKELLGAGAGVTTSSRARTALRWLLRWQYAFALVTVAVWMVVARDFLTTVRTPAGFDATDVEAADVSLSANLYASEEGATAVMQQAITALEQGGSKAAVALRLPVIDAGGGIWFRHAGAAGIGDTASYDVTFNVASSAYFDVMRIPTVAGRVFSESDRPGGAPVAVVNRAFAQRFFPDGSAVGREVTLTPFPTVVRRIVGVVDDVAQGGVGVAPTPAVIVPFVQLPVRRLHVVQRRADNTGYVPRIEDVIARLDPRIGVANALPFTARLRQAMSGMLLRLWLVSVLAGLGCVVAGTGALVQVSLATAEREKEFAIRIASGATTGRIVRLLAYEMAVDVAWASGAAAVILALGSGLVPELAAWPVARLIAAVFAGALALLVSAGVGSARPLWRVLHIKPSLLLRGV